MFLVLSLDHTQSGTYERNCDFAYQVKGHQKWPQLKGLRNVFKFQKLYQPKHGDKAVNIFSNKSFIEDSLAVNLDASVKHCNLQQQHLNIGETLLSTWTQF